MAWVGESEQVAGHLLKGWPRIGRSRPAAPLPPAPLAPAGLWAWLSLGSGRPVRVWRGEAGMTLEPVPQRLEGKQHPRGTKLWGEDPEGVRVQVCPLTLPTALAHHRPLE